MLKIILILIKGKLLIPFLFYNKIIFNSYYSFKKYDKNNNLAFLINAIFLFLFFKILHQNKISGVINLYGTSNVTKMMKMFLMKNTQ